MSGDSLSVEFSGEVIHVGATRAAGKVNACEIVIEQRAGEWPNQLPVTCRGKTCDVAQTLAEGDRVNVDCFVNGNAGKDKFAGRWFLKLAAKSVEKIGGGVKREDTRKDDAGDEGNVPF